MEELKVPVHVRSEAEYEQMLRAHGFTGTVIAHIPDLTATPDHYSGAWFANAEELREFKRIGALLLLAQEAGNRGAPVIWGTMFAIRTAGVA